MLVMFLSDYFPLLVSSETYYLLLDIFQGQEHSPPQKAVWWMNNPNQAVELPMV